MGKNQLYTELFTLKIAKSMSLTTHFNKINNLLKAVQTDEMKFTDDLIN